MTEPATFTCPSWCTAHHHRHGPFTDEMRGVVRHEPDEAVIVLDVTPSLGIRELTTVNPSRQEYYDDREPADRVELELDSPMTPADARKVADALLWAANLLDPPTDAPASVAAAGGTSGPPRAFPVGQRLPGDERFNAGLAFDVGRVLTHHGYPQLLSSRDLLDLERVLAEFIYGRPAPRGGA